MSEGPLARKDAADELSERLGIKKPERRGDVVRERDPIQEIEEATYRGERLRAFKRGAGIEEREPSAQVKETYGLNVGDIVKAQGEQIVSLIGQITNLVVKNPESQQAPLLIHLAEELRETKARLENAPDPWTVINQTQESMDAFAKRLKSSLGLPEGGKTNPSDFGQMLQLEEVRMEREERERRHQMEMEERRRQWAKEDKRWEEEFRLKRLEFVDSRKSKDRATDALEDLVGSVVDSIETERGEAGKEVAEEAPEEAPEPGKVRVRKPKAWKCECGSVVTLPSPEATEAICEACGNIFDIVEKKAEEEKGE